MVAASEQGEYVLDGFPRTVEQARLAYLTARISGSRCRSPST
jgi:adenylate kinase family enzyme